MRWIPRGGPSVMMSFKVSAGLPSFDEASKEYVNFLKHMSQKPRLKYDTPETRLSDFLGFFKQDLQALDREFVQYIQKQ